MCRWPVTPRSPTATAAIEAAAASLRDEPDLRHDILDAPRVLGVQEVLDDRIVLRLVVRTKPGARLEVQRQLRARLIDAEHDGRFAAPAPPAAPALEVHMVAPSVAPPATDAGSEVGSPPT